MYLTPPEDDLTRRSALQVLGAAALLLGAGGCADDDGERQGADAPTRTVEGVDGPVDVPVEPRRVVCTDFYTTYALLDVGFTPVGTAEATVGGVLPSQQQAYDALEKVGTTVEIDYEAVASLEPDLILGTLVPGLAEDLGERLAEIAPTLLFEAGTPGDWKERAVRAAEVVGRQEQGEELAADYDRRVDQLRRRYADAIDGSVWGLLRATTDGQAFTDGPTSWSGVVLADLGLRFSDGAPTDEVGTALSTEQLDAFADCDVVLYLANAEGDPDPATDEIVSDPLFRALPVTTDGEVVPLSSYYAAHYLDGMAVLDQVESVLSRL